MGLSPSMIWLGQRLSGIALVVFGLWLMYSLPVLLVGSVAEISAWLNNPLVCVVLLLTILVSFGHMILGLTVIIEDYVHNLCYQRLACWSVHGLGAGLALSSGVAIMTLALK